MIRILLKITSKEFFFSQNTYGAFLIIVSGLFVAVSNGLTHSLSIHFPAIQILFLKSSISLCLIVILFSSKLTTLTKTSIFRWHSLKGIVGVLGSWAWIVALQHLPLADSSALSLTSALLTSVGGYLFFGERPSFHVWFCVFLGFIGVLVVLNPSAQVVSVHSFFPLLAATAFAASSLLVKKICKQDSSYTILFYLMLFMSVFSSIPAIYSWSPIAVIDVYKIAIISVTYALGHFALIEAYVKAEASFIAPFKFARFPLGMATGLLFFSEFVSIPTLIGGVLITLSCFYLLRVENKKKSF
jgi:drug/metabolite transporter (DMT)-like permease